MARFILGISLLAVMAVGCGQSEHRPWEDRPVFPVAGQVLFQGKPAEGVEVIFHPVDSAQQSRPRGVTDAAGNFRLRTNSDGDGAPAGEYVVTFYWPVSSDRYGPGREQAPPDRLGRRFLDPQRSPWQATVTTSPTVVPPYNIR